MVTWNGPRPALGMVLAILLVVAGPWGLALAAGPAGGPDSRSDSRPESRPESRYALVIGVGTYTNAPELLNPRNDARAIGEALRGLNFTVDELYDLDARGFSTALRQFGLRASQADVAVIFYAGHGIQVGGVNYLIPADAQLERERDLVYEAIPLNLPLGELAQARKLGILILDACRNNPFVDRLTRTGSNRIQAHPGFGSVDDTPSDTLVAMATRADQLAEDGTGDHSPYSAALLEHLKTPGLELSLFFRNVRDTVRQATNGRQEPFIYGSLGAAPFYFNPRPSNRAPVLGDLMALTVTDKGGAAPMNVGKPSDPDDDQIFARVTGLPRGGSVRVDERSVLIGDYLTAEQLAATTFKPDGSFNGDAGAFEFTVSDGRGGSTAGTVPVTILPGNRPPVVAAERRLRAVANPLAIEAPTDPDGDSLTVTVTGVPDRGTVRNGAAAVAAGDRLTVQALAALSFDPGAAAPGPAGSLRYSVEDGRGGSAAATVELEVAGPGTAPVADLEESVWTRVRTSSEPGDYRAFLQLFGNGGHAALARRQLEMLGAHGRAETAAGPQPPSQPPSQPLPQPAPPTAPPPDPSGAAGQSASQAAGQMAAAAPPPPTGSGSGAANGAARNHGSGNSFQDCPTCPVMLRVPAGSFTMGNDRGDASERPAHRVAIAKPFALGVYEVTVGEWRACMQEGGCAEMPRISDATDATPVHNVHWKDADAYVAWLSRKTGQRYRLPSEAEWEYAARAGTAGPLWWGGETGVFADCDGCGGPHEALAPAAVGSYRPNPFGLHDMNGGVAEWVADCWNRDYRGAPADGGAWTKGDCRKRVLRGGSWRNKPAEIAAGLRNFYDADVRYLDNGFRVARDLK
ncbi:SUMF1/EgtB/PvdO family nonheme iron enzyme [Azospirillum picis]|uniref:Formylglycine-generating enzyme required for sulfatase activity n=1 Tax=Azospirillum picis TaxID=488438 RepID=A0ABU0MQ55_9PROT|nr:SUMF1/EgtB/PvdO family nonheme iron enzyme [Azospirillum picis]MBP2302110.1 formylglycine-generating enzyme required for sulfatase activity [Azospirillum picis]MDQ0535599.1 formylglycine-generating enzyme required for sulfatase activity [Azospirillum picis]